MVQWPSLPHSWTSEHSLLLVQGAWQMVSLPHTQFSGRLSQTPPGAHSESCWQMTNGMLQEGQLFGALTRLHSSVL